MAVKKGTGKATKRAKKPKKPEGKKLRIELVRSVIGRPRQQREVVKGLGLRRINSRVVREDCPEIRGMIAKIPHLLEVKELD
jgi:large subunit ribosomal protein L30